MKFLIAGQANCGVLDNILGQNLCNSSDLNVVINQIANILVGFMGLILAIVILVSAVQIVTAGGNPEGIKGAKGRLTQAAVSLGLLVAFRGIIALLGIN